MTFAIEHIAIAFGLGFFFGSLFGIGFSLRKKNSTRTTLSNTQPSMPSEPPLDGIQPRESTSQTLDIPTIRPDSDLAEDSLGISIELPEPEPLHTSEVRMFSSDREAEDDATVLMQKPPPK